MVISCSHTSPVGDRRLSKKEIPVFMQSYLDYPEVEFYEKSQQKGDKRFEVKYLEKDKEISLAFNELGNLLEEERDIDLKDLDPVVQKKILKYIENKFAGAKILEIEKRMEQGKKHFIDIEIRSATSRSGYWELSFTPEGDYVYQEEENYHSVETLN